MRASFLVDLANALELVANAVGYQATVVRETVSHESYVIHR
jgi:hypothetical protein